MYTGKAHFLRDITGAGTIKVWFTRGLHGMHKYLGAPGISVK